MVCSSDNFIPHSIVGNDSLLGPGYSIYYTTSPHTRDKTTMVQKHKQQPKLQIKLIDRFSISQRSPQNDWQ